MSTLWRRLFPRRPALAALLLTAILAQAALVVFAETVDDAHGQSGLWSLDEAGSTATQCRWVRADDFCQYNAPGAYPSQCVTIPDFWRKYRVAPRAWGKPCPFLPPAGALYDGSERVTKASTISAPPSGG